MRLEKAFEYPYHESVLYRSDEEKALLRVIRKASLQVRMWIGWPLGFHPSSYGMVVVDFAATDFVRALARSVAAATERGPGIGLRCCRLSARPRRLMRGLACAMSDSERQKTPFNFVHSLS